MLEDPLALVLLPGETPRDLPHAGLKHHAEGKQQHMQVCVRFFRMRTTCPEDMKQNIIPSFVFLSIGKDSE